MGSGHGGDVPRLREVGGQAARQLWAGPHPAQVRATYFELVERLDKQPMVGVDGVIFRMANFGYLYSPGQYAKIAEVWESVLTDDVAGLAKDWPLMRRSVRSWRPQLGARWMGLTPRPAPRSHGSLTTR